MTQLLRREEASYRQDRGILPQAPKSCTMPHHIHAQWLQGVVLEDPALLACRCACGRDQS